MHSQKSRALYIRKSDLKKKQMCINLWICFFFLHFKRSSTNKSNEVAHEYYAIISRLLCSVGHSKLSY